ncbi:hypothetical protein LUZ60_005277 [Juncus effusus]|nr:hypothetical protein LUZ60_005277 [Juncus effusus]
MAGIAVSGEWRRMLRSSTFSYLISCAILLGSVAVLFSRVAFPPFSSSSFSDFESGSSVSGCRSDGEGSWSIGIFYGDSPFSLKPIEQWDIWRNESAAWPVANPVVTCKSLSQIGVPSNFVADPFLFIQGDILYLFFETKNSVTLQGDIGAAVSEDRGASWRQLGIVLDEKWHLSYPYVFSDNNQIYMMPEGSKKGDLRLYRAINFPTKWKLEKIIIKKPLVDSFIIKHENRYFIFGSDHTSKNAIKNGELEIYYSDSLFSNFKPHKKNPVLNKDKSLGARNAGRPFLYKGNLYRSGQNCGQTYGQSIKIFRIDKLTIDEYEETEVDFRFEKSNKGINSWNNARYHQLDLVNISDDKWIGVMDGDRVPSGEVSIRVLKGFIAYFCAVIIVFFLGFLSSVIKCGLPVLGKRRVFVCYKIASCFGYFSKFGSVFEGRINPKSWNGRFLIAILVIISIGLTCFGTNYIFGGNGTNEPYIFKGHYSQFTILTMSHESRIQNLKTFTKQYSKCASVREIIIIWNKGIPPKKSEFKSQIPIRIRVENNNTLNNRFKIDKSIKTKAVLELDDDIMLTCDDLERGFRVWRENPELISGFFPRLADGIPVKYHDIKYARKKNGYNIILTDAAFIDHELAFKRYWSEEGKLGRGIIDKYFDCEDLLMNFLYFNASEGKRKTVQYVKPSWVIDRAFFSLILQRSGTLFYNQLLQNCNSRKIYYKKILK